MNINEGVNMDKEISRITMDFPKEVHKKLKAQAAMRGMPLRDVILESVAIANALAIDEKERIRYVQQLLDDSQSNTSPKTTWEEVAAEFKEFID